MLVALYSLVNTHLALAQCTTGLVIEESNSRDRKRVVSNYSDALPLSKSLKQYCPKPSTQLYFSTSAGWAASYYALSILEAQKKNLSNLNEITELALAPVFPYSYLSMEGCEIKTSIVDILDALKVAGTPTFRDYPYFCPENNWKPEGKELTRLQDFVKVFGQNDPKVGAIKTALASGNPLVIGLKVPPTFCDADGVWRPYEGISSKYEGHALCVVGYDDNLNGGSIEVVNSWGRGWGNNGFTRIRYSDVERWAAEGYQLLGSKVSEKLQISIAGKLSHGSPMEVEFVEGNQYRFKYSYGSGTEFGFEINSNFSGHLYITYRSNSGQRSTLFPNDSQSPVMPYSANRINFPTEGRIRLDNSKGEESIYFIVSQFELSDEALDVLSVSKLQLLSANKFNPKWMAVEMGELNEPLVIEVILDHI